MARPSNSQTQPLFCNSIHINLVRRFLLDLPIILNRSTSLGHPEPVLLVIVNFGGQFAAAATLIQGCEKYEFDSDLNFLEPQSLRTCRKLPLAQCGITFLMPVITLKQNLDIEDFSYQCWNRLASRKRASLILH